MQPSPSRNRSLSVGDSGSENQPVLTASTNPADLVKIARRYELEKNNAEAELNALRRKLSDITNDDNETQTPHRSKRRMIRSSSSDSQDEDVGSRANDTFVYHAGHKFFLVHGPWVHLGEDLFETEFDEAYNAAERFENDESKAQGQLQEVWRLLCGKFEQVVLQQKWVHRAFLKGLKTERYNTASRIRNHCAAIFNVPEVDLMNAEARKTKFRDQIGWVDNGPGGGSSYSSVDVEILHKNYAGEYSLSSIFLNPILMGIYIALIRGPKAGKTFMAGIAYQPQTETMAQIHGIRNITLGAIATASVLARWALSCDETLQAVGTSTGIRYFDDYEEYLKILETGLRRNKKSVLNIIKEWDSRIFPNTDSSLVGTNVKSTTDDRGLRRAMEALDADSEEDEVPGGHEPDGGND